MDKNMNFFEKVLNIKQKIDGYFFIILLIFLIFINIFFKMNNIINEIKNLIIIDYSINNSFLENINDFYRIEDFNKNETFSFSINFLKSHFKKEDLNNFVKRMIIKYKIFSCIKNEKDSYNIIFFTNIEKNFLLKKNKIEKEQKKFLKRFK